MCSDDWIRAHAHPNSFEIFKSMLKRSISIVIFYLIFCIRTSNLNVEYGWRTSIPPENKNDNRTKKKYLEEKRIRFSSNFFPVLILFLFPGAVLILHLYLRVCLFIRFTFFAENSLLWVVRAIELMLLFKCVM